MWQLNKGFKDPQKAKTSDTVVLNHDISAMSGKISYPIVWTGWIGIERVKIIQIESAFTTESFVFELFPDKYAFLKNQIVKWIRDYLNKSGNTDHDEK